MLLVVLLFGSGVLHEPVAAAPLYQKGEFTLSDLGSDGDIVLHGPYDTASIRFGLPATWKLQEGSEISIDVSSVITGLEGISAQSGYSGAILEVYFNGRFEQSIPLLTNGKTNYWVQIKTADLVSPNEGGWHKLSFTLYSQFDCDLNFHQTTVVIDSQSKAYFPYEEIPLALDLRRLPWPIYQQHTKTLDQVLVIIPAAPTADELQAALVVMGAFGRMTNGNLPVKMVTVDQLTESQMAQDHLILVGKPSAFPLFSGLAYPVPLVGGEFSTSGMQADDGVLQMIPSPWNGSKIVMVVSGNTDLGVVKSAQALSTVNLQTGNAPNYSIIAQVNPAPAGVFSGTSTALATSSDIKLSDIGYTFVTSTGMGSNWVDYEFTIPPGSVPAEMPYLDLTLSTSTLVDPTRSDGVVYLNEVQIGSIPLTATNSNLITTRINFPLSVVRSGINTIDLVFNLLPYDECSLTAFTDLWITIYSDSVIHLPLKQTPVSSFAIQDLSMYPYPFANEPSLSTIAFVFPQQDAETWLIASRLAYDLGTRVTGSILAFEVVFDGQIPDGIRTMDLILMGEPKMLPIVDEFKDAMPAYFENGSNVAVLDSQQVIYRISDNKSLGYLELFPSPWNQQASILGIFGTSPEGLASALNALLDVNTRENLTGDFATMDGSDAIIVDTRSGTGTGDVVNNLGPSLVSQTNESNSVDVPDMQKALANSKRIILAGVVLVVTLMVAITIVAIFLRKKPR